MTTTFISVVAALLIGGVEALGLIEARFSLHGWFWDAIAALNDRFGALGWLIAALFAITWLGSVLFYRHRGLALRRPLEQGSPR